MALAQISQNSEKSNSRLRSRSPSARTTLKKTGGLISLISMHAASSETAGLSEAAASSVFKLIASSEHVAAAENLKSFFMCWFPRAYGPREEPEDSSHLHKDMQLKFELSTLHEALRCIDDESGAPKSWNDFEQQLIHLVSSTRSRCDILTKTQAKK